MSGKFLTLGEVARLFNCQLWQVRRVYERGLLPDALRVGKQRVVPKKDLPKLRKVMVAERYIRHESAKTARRPGRALASA